MNKNVINHAPDILQINQIFKMAHPPTDIFEMQHNDDDNDNDNNNNDNNDNNNNNNNNNNNEYDMKLLCQFDCAII